MFCQHRNRAVRGYGKIMSRNDFYISLQNNIADTLLLFQLFDHLIQLFRISKRKMHPVFIKYSFFPGSFGIIIIMLEVCNIVSKFYNGTGRNNNTQHDKKDFTFPVRDHL